MKDFALQYVDYENMAKQLLPETNQVQHWSKIIETRSIISRPVQRIVTGSAVIQKVILVVSLFVKQELSRGDEEDF